MRARAPTRKKQAAHNSGCALTCIANKILSRIPENKDRRDAGTNKWGKHRTHIAETKPKISHKKIRANKSQCTEANTVKHIHEHIDANKNECGIQTTHKPRRQELKRKQRQQWQNWERATETEQKNVMYYETKVLLFSVQFKIIWEMLRVLLIWPPTSPPPPPMYYVLLVVEFSFVFYSIIFCFSPLFHLSHVCMCSLQFFCAKTEQTSERERNREEGGRRP